MNGEKEQPAKVYQIEAIQFQLDNQKEMSAHLNSMLEKINEKQDKILEKQITAQYLDERLKSTEDAFDAKIREVHLEYKPYIRNMQWVMKAVVGALLAVAGQIVVVIINSLSK